jgi:hypothetical protein
MGIPENGGTNQKPGAVDGAGEMSGFQKFEYCVRPFLFGAISSFWVAIASLALIYLFISKEPLWRHVWADVAIVFIFCLGVPLLRYSIAQIWKNLRRKRTTGSFLPAGEELAAVRFRGKHPSIWRRLYVTTFFCLVAVGATRSLILSPNHRLAYWSIPALMWVVAIFVAIGMFLPRPQRRWTGIGVAAAYGLTALIGTVFVLLAPKPRLSYWSLPIFMAFMSLIVTAVVLADQRRASGEPHATP